MKPILETVCKNKLRTTLIVGTTFVLTFLPFYGDKFVKWPLWLQVTFILAAVILHLFASTYSEVSDFIIENAKLKEEVGDLRSDVITISKSKDAELAELKDVIVQFLEYSHAYQDRVLQYLKIRGHFLCIAKSSEGLSEVYNRLPNPKPQLPFSKVLTQWPGSIRPFENMNIYFLPVAGLDGFKDSQPKKWIDANIIPKVAEERHKFLTSLPKRTAALSDDFSYKYLAFMIQRDSIEYDTRNRKFSKEFVDTFVRRQDQRRLAKMTEELSNIIRGKDFFDIVDWSAFVDLNAEQKKLFSKNRKKLSDLLIELRLNSFNAIANASEEELIFLYKRAFGVRKFSDTKAKNLAKKTREGTNHVRDVLRKHGVSI